MLKRQKKYYKNSSTWDKSRRVTTRKNTTWFQKKTYRIDGYGTQHIINVFGKTILIGKNDYSFYIVMNENKKCGFNITSKPPFSIREKKRKFIKIGKYFIFKTK